MVNSKLARITNRSILFIVRGDDTFPSCRFRAWQFKDPLASLGVRADYVILEKSRNPFKQLLFHLRLISQLKSHHAVVFQKLLEPWRLHFIRFFNANLHYDFDDAMYQASDGAKFAATIKAAPHIIAGNETLAIEARKYNSDVTIIPTVIPIPEISLSPSQKSRDGEFILSWIGTGPNLTYLAPILAAIDDMDSTSASGLTLRILTDKPELAPVRPWIISLPWSHVLEESEFRGCDVGLMPLPDTLWGQGKCACKALQYLSFGKPVITSPVGMNRDLFQDGSFGILANTTEEWKAAIRSYRNNVMTRQNAGDAGYLFVKKKFSLDWWTVYLAEHLLGLSHEVRQND
jgi:glycosyltransferase involved in cell wall biosynthesis